MQLLVFYNHTNKYRIRHRISIPIQTNQNYLTVFRGGGGTDFLARLLSTKLSTKLNQPVIVENRPGANGLIGTELVAKANPDGYTLLLGTLGTHGINAAAYEKLPYDTIRDFSPISMIARTPMLVLVHPSVKAKTIGEFIKETSTRKVPFAYASSGVGSVGHVGAQLFATTAGIQMIHVPYKGAAPAVADLLGGQVQLMFGTPVSTVQYVKTGQIKMLGVASVQRSKLAPEIPTLSEQGLQGFDVSTWYGLIAPAKTPSKVVNVLATAVSEFLTDPDVQRQMLEQGLEAVGNKPEEFDKQIRNEALKWSKINLNN